SDQCLELRRCRKKLRQGRRYESFRVRTTNGDVVERFVHYRYLRFGRAVKQRIIIVSFRNPYLQLTHSRPGPFLTKDGNGGLNITASNPSASIGSLTQKVSGNDIAVCAVRVILDNQALITIFQAPSQQNLAAGQIKDRTTSMDIPRSDISTGVLELLGPNCVY